MPPTTIAIICLKPWLMPRNSNTATGVSRPTPWPSRMPRMPTWNSIDPTTNCLRRRNWLDFDRQPYWSVSNRSRLPIRNTDSAMYGIDPEHAPDGRNFAIFKLPLSQVPWRVRAPIAPE